MRIATGMIEDCTVIVRSVGERTEELCRRLLSEVFPDQNIAIISDTPFSATLKKSLQFGLKSGRTWTFCVDADVLIDKENILELFNRANRTEESVFELHGFVLDKFFNEFRPAGNHLYRTAHLSTAIMEIPREGDALRPETAMIKSMNKGKYRNLYFSDLVVGLHDFEQSYEDIFAKGYLHANKHTKHISRLLPYWKSMAEQDRDFEVLLWGIATGIAQVGNVFADKSKIPVKAFDFYNNAVAKKEILSYNKFDRSIIEEVRRQVHPSGNSRKPIVKRILRKLSTILKFDAGVGA